MENELIENYAETSCYASDFNFSHNRFSKHKPRTSKKDGTRGVPRDVAADSKVNMKLERRKERENQEIVYFLRV